VCHKKIHGASNMYLVYLYIVIAPLLKRSADLLSYISSSEEIWKYLDISTKFSRRNTQFTTHCLQNNRIRENVTAQDCSDCKLCIGKFFLGTADIYISLTCQMQSNVRECARRRSDPYVCSFSCKRMTLKIGEKGKRPLSKNCRTCHERKMS